MLIDLKSIDEDGEHYDFDELSEEVEGAFSDLIGKTPFKISLDIHPLGNTFQVKGHLTSEYQEMCSQCGYDISVPLKSSINEIVVIEKERPRNTQVSQSQQNLMDAGPSVTYVNEPVLNLTEFLHEMMAAGFQLYPRCQDEELCQSRQFKTPIIQKETEEKKGHPGFASLKDFKVTKH